MNDNNQNQPNVQPEAQQAPAMPQVNPNDSTFTKNDVDSGKAMAILSYIGFLVFIPFFAEKNNKFVVFHAKQGMNLLILEGIAVVALTILDFIFGLIPFLGWILAGLLSFAVSGGIIALSVIGIVNAAKGLAKKLPVVGDIKIIK